MSEENVTTTATNGAAIGALGTGTARKMVSVNNKELGPREGKGNLNFVKLSKLTDVDNNTIIASGIYEGTQKYEFENGDSRTDFIIRDAEGNASSVSPCAALVNQLGKVPTGSYVELTYLGKKAIKGGKTAHTFVVGVDSADLNSAE